MRIIKVATDDGSAFYQIVSRLKATRLKFSVPSSWTPKELSEDFVVTSRKELASFEGDAVAVEDLSEDPLVFEAQLLSRLLDQPRRDLLIGVDPGLRIGVAVFYGGREVGAFTSDSVEKSVGYVAKLEDEVPHSSLTVKVGGGEPKSCFRLARLMRQRLPPGASVEIVNESGTSAGKRGAIGARRDQRAAARIAFRKGTQFGGSSPRNSG